MRRPKRKYPLLKKAKSNVVEKRIDMKKHAIAHVVEELEEKLRGLRDKPVKTVREAELTLVMIDMYERFWQDAQNTLQGWNPERGSR